MNLGKFVQEQEPFCRRVIFTLHLSNFHVFNSVRGLGVLVTFHSTTVFDGSVPPVSAVPAAAHVSVSHFPGWVGKSDSLMQNQPVGGRSILQ